MKVNSIINTPCHKYLVRAVDNVEQQLELAKSFFHLCSINKISIDESKIRYTALAPYTAGLNKNYEITTYNGVVLDINDFYEAVTKNDNIKEYASCREFAQSISPTIADSCKICPYAGKNYTNSNFNKELSVLKYIMKCPEHLFLFSSIGNLSFFQANIDLASGLIYKQPIVFNLNRNICQELMILGATFFDNKKDKLEEIQISVLANAQNNVAVRELLLCNQRAFSVAWEQTINDIFSAKDIDDTKLQDYISDICNKRGKKRKPKNSQSKEVPPLFLLTPYDSNNSKLPKNHAETIKEDDMNNVVTSKETHLEKVSLDSFENKNEVYLDSDALNESKQTNKIDKLKSKTINDVIIKPENEDNETLNTKGITNVLIEEPKKELNKQTLTDSTNNESVENDNTIFIPIQKEENLIYKPYISFDKIKSFFLPFEEHSKNIILRIKQSKQLPIEVVESDDGFYFVIFIKSTGKFYYENVNDLSNIFLALLKSQSISKIIWQPYFLFSLCKVADNLIVQNVHSIFSMDLLLYPTANPDTHDKILSIYTEKLMKNETIITGDNAVDSLVNYMPYYVYIRNIQTRNLPISDKQRLIDYKYMMYKDQVLGCSFIRSKSLKNLDLLFTISPDGEFIFNQDYTTASIKNGYLVSYAINTDQLQPDEIKKLYFDALVDLASKGRFKKLDIQLITISEAVLKIYVSIECYELLTTLLQHFFNKYALLNQLDCFELTADEMILSNTHRLSNESTSNNLHNFNSAMDLLTSVNEEIIVDDSRLKHQTKNKKQSERLHF